MSLDLRDLPKLIHAKPAGGRAYFVTIFDERYTVPPVACVMNCDSIDDAAEAVVPYINTNYLKKLRFRAVKGGLK